MANVIKHKRGSGSDPVASDLVVGEVAIRTDVGKLFTKMDNGSVAEIAGGGSDIIINTLSSSSATGGGSATFNGSAYRFTLSQPPSVSAQQLLVSVNGVIQKPVAGTGQPSEGFSVSGNDIIFGDAPATGADFFILTFKSLGVSEPADNSVTSAKIVDGAIVNADINASAAIQGTKITPSFTGNISITNVAPKIFLTDSDTNSDFSIRNMHGVFGIHDQTNSEDRFTILSNGLVGIGTTTPIEQLHIANAANCILLLEDTDSANQVGVRYKTTTGEWIAGVHGGQSNQWKLSNSNSFGTSDYLTVGTNAAVGIAGFFTMTCVNPSIYFNESSANPDYRLYNNGGSFRLKDTTNGVERLVVNSSGQVGIGTTSPSYELVVAPADTNESTLQILAGGNGKESNIFFGAPDDADVGKISYDHNGDNFKFVVNTHERMRVISDGRVLIGTQNGDPYGNRRLTVAQGTSTNTTVAIEVRSPTNGDGRIIFTDSTSNDSGAYKGQIRYDQTDDFMLFNTNGDNERFKIHSNGNVSIQTNNVGFSGAGTLRINSGSTAGGLNLDGGASNHGGEINLTGGSNGGRIQFRTGQGAGQQTEKMRLNENGKLGIGTTSPQGGLHVQTGTITELNLWSSAGYGRSKFNLRARDTGSSVGLFQLHTESTVPTQPMLMTIRNSGDVMFGTENNDSGGSAIGNNFGFVYQPSGHAIVRSGSTSVSGASGICYTAKFVDTGTGKAFRVMLAQTEIGSIGMGAGGTSFNTSSDYRRKENIVDLTNAITRLKTLLPKRFNFKDDPSVTRDGFLAHEVTAVPEAVTGTKDAVEPEDNEKSGVKKGDPIYQQLDQSKLIPLLVAALQEAIGRIEVLEAK